ncbi:hypothetical protein [Saccharopolyspora spinosa]|uniref:hypothetical protein n=1 Tax=Saccharopolyspora spinosa TaxID=60894 RepID=UPI0037481F67
MKAKAGTKHRVGVESGATIGTQRQDFWRTLGFLASVSAQFSHGYSSTLGQSHKVHRRARFVGPAVTFDRLVTWSISVSVKDSIPQPQQPQPQTGQAGSQVEQVESERAEPWTEHVESRAGQPEAWTGRADSETERVDSETGHVEPGAGWVRPWYRRLGLFGGRADRSGVPGGSDIELDILSGDFLTADSDSDTVGSFGVVSTIGGATTATGTVAGWARVLVPEPLAPTTPQGDLSGLGAVVRDFDYDDQDGNPFEVNVEFLMPQGVATPSTVLSEPIEARLRGLAGAAHQDTAGEDSLEAQFDELVGPGGVPVAGGRVRLRLFDVRPVGTAAAKLNLEVGAEGGLKLDGQEMRGRGWEGRLRGSAWMLFGGASSRAYVVPSLTGRGKFSEDSATAYGLGTARRGSAGRAGRRTCTGRMGCSRSPVTGSRTRWGRRSGSRSTGVSSSCSPTLSRSGCIPTRSGNRQWWGSPRGPGISACPRGWRRSRNR